MRIRNPANNICKPCRLLFYCSRLAKRILYHYGGFYKNGADKSIWLIDSGTAPGQAETFDYSSKMAASKEAAAAAAAKVLHLFDLWKVLESTRQRGLGG